MKKQTILYFIVLFLIPVFTVSIIYNSLDKKEIAQQQTEKSTKTTISKITTQTIIKTTTKKEEVIQTIKVNKDNKIIEMPLEEYIVGVVAGEMPATFENVALEAQAIASRTYAMYKIKYFDEVYNVESTTDDQVYLSIDEMKTKWLEDYNKYYNKIKNAVTKTKNLVMKKNNQVFKCYYFSMSNGYTEDSVSVFGENTSSSVKSSWDNNTLNKYEVGTTFTLSDLKQKLSTNVTNIEIISRNKTNHVTKVKVNDKYYTGIEFRKLLTLRSTDFDIKKNNDNYIITTRGYGHGVGMSQYGANGMAKENYSYEEILKYYYQNIEITNI